MRVIDLLKKIRRQLMFMGKFGFRIFCLHIKKEKIFICADSAVHGNMGDQALGFCRREFLVQRCGIKPQNIIEYTARDRMRYWDFIVKYTRKQDVVCLRGGGYWGDLWLDGFTAMLDYIESFHENRIIVFPQSVYFSNTNEGRKWLKKSQMILNEAENLLFFTRDIESKRIVESVYSGIRVTAVPDTVLSYKPQCELDQNRAKVLLCFRNDKEKLDSWADLVQPTLKRLNEEYFFQDTSIDLNIRRLGERAEALKNIWNVFQSAKLVITDRLHGMIFATITGTPCLVFNNIDGKVGHEYQWIRNLGYVHFYDGSCDIDSVIGKMLTIRAVEYPIEKMNSLFDPLVSVCVEAKKE